jgi:hypothetical protein
VAYLRCVAHVGHIAATSCGFCEQQAAGSAWNEGSLAAAASTSSSATVPAGSAMAALAAGCKSPAGWFTAVICP